MIRKDGHSVHADTLRPPTYEDYRRYVDAVEQVKDLLDRTTQALDAVGLEYAVVGGNAVAAWVSTVDPDAVRTTKDVDLLVRRSDLDRIANALRPIGLVPAEVHGVIMFVDSTDPSPKRAVHVLLANELVRAFYSHPAPDVAGAVRGVLGFRIIPLLDLVQMKLQSFRLRDQTHLVDLLLVELIDATWKSQLPLDLQDRFQQVLDAYEQERDQP